MPGNQKSSIPEGSKAVKTYFASPERTSEAKLKAEIEFASNNPIISGLLQSISGLIAVLDGNRQIIALNDTLLEVLGVNDPALALGLRLGEAMHCIHSDKEPGGCGTSQFCSTCGAAIAQVACLKDDKPVEKICALTTKIGENQVDRAILVKAHPLKMNRQKFMLIFLQDITKDQQRAALERTFFHDISNMLCLMVGTSEMMADQEPSPLSRMLSKATRRIVQEVAIQRYLSKSESENYEPNWQNFTGEQVFEELEAFYSEHSSATSKEVDFSREIPQVAFRTDVSLLLRVLCNMITNALEASDVDGLVRVWMDQEDKDSVTFNVWNAAEIPPDIARRIFQMNFSTKEQSGRGVGTYSMKLLGEKILGGRVDFVTSSNEGTIFRYTCPCD